AAREGRALLGLARGRARDALVRLAVKAGGAVGVVRAAGLAHVGAAREGRALLGVVRGEGRAVREAVAALLQDGDLPGAARRPAHHRRADEAGARMPLDAVAGGREAGMVGRARRAGRPGPMRLVAGGYREAHPLRAGDVARLALAEAGGVAAEAVG